MDGDQLKSQYKTGVRNFQGLELPGINLAWVELRDVDLRGADLSHAKLSGADLSGSNLSQQTNLAFADLSRASLRNTNLKGTRLEGANLEDANLEGAVYDETTQFPRGFKPRGGIPSGILAQANDQTINDQTNQSLNSELLSAEPSPRVEEPEALDQKEQAAVETAALYEDLAQYSAQTLPNPLPDRSRLVNPDQSTSLVNEGDRANGGGASTPQLASPAVSDWQITHPPDWMLAAVPQTDLFSNSSGQGNASHVPAGIKGWNWGAFLLPHFWFMPNQVWGGILLWLLSLVPGWNAAAVLVYAIAFGKKGNEWAWRARPWDSQAAFKKHQQAWAIAGFFVWGLIIALAIFSFQR